MKRNLVAVCTNSRDENGLKLIDFIGDLHVVSDADLHAGTSKSR